MGISLAMERNGPSPKILVDALSLTRLNVSGGIFNEGTSSSSTEFVFFNSFQLANNEMLATAVTKPTINHESSLNVQVPVETFIKVAGGALA